MEILKDKYTITELSANLNITDHALRYYEKEFGLEVPKDSRGRRYYPTHLANIMFQIKRMRDEGLEIKAIKKILCSEHIISDPPPVVVDDNPVAVVPVSSRDNTADIRQFFDEFREQLLSSVASEVACTREQLSREITKSKLELGACVENSMRKLESKMEKHFMDVDRALGNWRDKSKGNTIKKWFKKLG